MYGLKTSSIRFETRNVLMLGNKRQGSFKTVKKIPARFWFRRLAKSYLAGIFHREKTNSIPNPSPVVQTGSSATSMHRPSAYFRTRYNPIPVAFCLSGWLPVKPLSKRNGASSGGTPDPLFRTARYILSPLRTKIKHPKARFTVN